MSPLGTAPEYCMSLGIHKDRSLLGRDLGFGMHSCNQNTLSGGFIFPHHHLFHSLLLHSNHSPTIYVLLSPLCTAVDVCFHVEPAACSSRWQPTHMLHWVMICNYRKHVMPPECSFQWHILVGLVC